MLHMPLPLRLGADASYYTHGGDTLLRTPWHVDDPSVEETVVWKNSIPSDNEMLVHLGPDPSEVMAMLQPPLPTALSVDVDSGTHFGG